MPKSKDPYQIDKDKRLLELVNIIKKKDKKDENIDVYFNEIVQLMNTKIKQIVYKFNIIGYDKDDIYQESLMALRFNAIKDYDASKGSNGPYPFEKFAALCINRWLMTKVKATYRQKSKALNFSISLDQDVSDHHETFENFLSLVDVVQSKHIEEVETYIIKDFYRSICEDVFERLSTFEQKVFMLYMQNYSYEEIANVLDKSKKKDKQSSIKSVDNALVRIKMKANEVLEKYKDQLDQ